jgi:hypothetical protein
VLATAAVGADIVFGTDVIVAEPDAEDAALLPMAFVAKIVNVCAVPEGDVSRPVTVAGDPSESTTEPPGVPVTVYEVIGSFPSHDGAEYVIVAAPSS